MQIESMMATKRSYSYGGFVLIVATVSSHLVAVILFILILVWLLYFQDGLAFVSYNKAKIFNIHPMLMLGFVLISGEAVMAYKTVPATKKKQKLVHLVLHVIALVSAIIGTVAVFKFHREREIPDMYTLHSWFGICTLCLFGLQWLVSFYSFWYPRAPEPTRAKLAPWHAVFGVTIFFMAILSAETGLIEKFVFLGLKRGPEALLVNFTGLFILLFGVFVGLSVLLPRS